MTNPTASERKLYAKGRAHFRLGRDRCAAVNNQPNGYADNYETLDGVGVVAVKSTAHRCRRQYTAFQENAEPTRSPKLEAGGRRKEQNPSGNMRPWRIAPLYVHFDNVAESEDSCVGQEGYHQHEKERFPANFRHLVHSNGHFNRRQERADPSHFAQDTGSQEA